MTEKSDFDRVLDELRTQRDELKVKLHLAKAEARDEWEKAEKKWEHLRAKLDVVGREAADTGSNVLAATKLVAREIKDGYDRIRTLLRPTA